MAKAAMTSAKKPSAKKAAAKAAKKPAAKAAKKPAAKAAKKPAAKAAKKPAAKKPVAKPAAKKPAKPAAAKPAMKPAETEPAQPPAAEPVATPTKVKLPAPPAVLSEEDAVYAPATLQTLENGGYALYFDIGAFDGDHLDVPGAFARVDLSGSGDEWEAVLAPALKRAHPSSFAAIEWGGSEADTFVVHAKDKPPLAALAAVLRDVLKTQTSLQAAIARHDPDRT